jgi:hypothetical protein
VIAIKDGLAVNHERGEASKRKALRILVLILVDNLAEIELRKLSCPLIYTHTIIIIIIIITKKKISIMLPSGVGITGTTYPLRCCQELAKVLDGHQGRLLSCGMLLKYHLNLWAISKVVIEGEELREVQGACIAGVNFFHFLLQVNIPGLHVKYTKQILDFIVAQQTVFVGVLSIPFRL